MSEVRESERLLFDALDPSEELAVSVRGRFTPPPVSDLAGLGAVAVADDIELLLLLLQRLLRSLRSLPLPSGRARAAHIRPRFPRPFGVRLSRSLVGDSVANLQRQTG